MEGYTDRFCDPEGDGGDGSSGDPWDFYQMVANAANGDLVHIAGGSVTLSASQTMSNTPDASGHIYLSANPSSPLQIDFDGNTFTVNARTHIEGMSGTTADFGGAMFTLGDNSVAYNCSGDCAGIEFYGSIFSGGSARLVGCYARKTGTGSLNSNVFAEKIEKCYIESLNTIVAYDGNRAEDSIFVGGLAAIQADISFGDDCFYKNVAVSGALNALTVQANDSPAGSIIMTDSILFDCSNGFNGNTNTLASPLELINVAHNTFSGDKFVDTAALIVDVNPVTLTGNPWIDPENGDWRLNDTAGAGAACRDAGAQNPGQLVTA